MDDTEVRTKPMVWKRPGRMASPEDDALLLQHLGGALDLRYTYRNSENWYRDAIRDLQNQFPPVQIARDNYLANLIEIDLAAKDKTAQGSARHKQLTALGKQLQQTLNSAIDHAKYPTVRLRARQLRCMRIDQAIKRYQKKPPSTFRDQRLTVARIIQDRVEKLYADARREDNAIYLDAADVLKTLKSEHESERVAESRKLISGGTRDVVYKAHEQSTKDRRFGRLRVNVDRGEGTIRVRDRNADHGRQRADCPWQLGDERYALHAKGRKEFRLLRLTLSSNLGQPEILYMHVHDHSRELPAGIVPYVAVSRRREGTRFKYSVEITVYPEPSADLPDGQRVITLFAQPGATWKTVTRDLECSVSAAKEARDLHIQSHPAPEIAVAIDPGWHLVPGGIRIARGIGTDGKAWDLVLNDELIRQRHYTSDGERLHGRDRVDGYAGPWARFERTSSLQSTRDQNMNNILTSLKAARQGSPQWFQTYTSQIDKWKSVKRLMSLLGYWRRNLSNMSEWTAGDVILSQLQDFVTHDVHLREYQTGNSRTMHNQVLTTQKEFATHLAKRYQHLFVEDMDYDRVTRPRSSDPLEVSRCALNRKRIQTVAPLRTGALIKQAAQKWNRQHHDVCATYNSQTCSNLECGGHIPKSKLLFLWCPSCGAFYDRDENAALNILRRGLASIPGLERVADHLDVRVLEICPANVLAT